jgi:hypothetical protein
MKKLVIGIAACCVLLLSACLSRRQSDSAVRSPDAATTIVSIDKQVIISHEPFAVEGLNKEIVFQFSNAVNLDQLRVRVKNDDELPYWQDISKRIDFEGKKVSYVLSCRQGGKVHYQFSLATMDSDIPDHKQIYRGSISAPKGESLKLAQDPPARQSAHFMQIDTNLYKAGEEVAITAWQKTLLFHFPSVVNRAHLEFYVITERDGEHARDDGDDHHIPYERFLFDKIDGPNTADYELRVRAGETVVYKFKMVDTSTNPETVSKFKVIITGPKTISHAEEIPKPYFKIDGIVYPHKEVTAYGGEFGKQIFIKIPPNLDKLQITRISPGGKRWDIPLEVGASEFSEVLLSRKPPNLLADGPVIFPAGGVIGIIGMGAAGYGFGLGNQQFKLVNANDYSTSYRYLCKLSAQGFSKTVELSLKLYSAPKALTSSLEIPGAMMFIDGVPTPSGVSIKKSSVKVSFKLAHLPIKSVEVISHNKADSSKIVRTLLGEETIEYQVALRDKNKEHFIFRTKVASGEKQEWKREDLLGFTLVDENPSSENHADIDGSKLNCSRFNSVACPPNVGLLLINSDKGQARCTSFHLKDNIFVTNAHCIPDTLIKDPQQACAGTLKTYLLEKVGANYRAQRYECDSLLFRERNEFLDYAFYTVNEAANFPAADISTEVSDNLYLWSVFEEETQGVRKPKLVLRRSECAAQWGRYRYFEQKGALNASLALGGNAAKCPMQGGVSGSPIYNSREQLVGLIHSGIRRTVFAPERLGQRSQNVTESGSSFHCIKVPGRNHEELPECKTWSESRDRRLTERISSLLTASDHAKLSTQRSDYEQRIGSAQLGEGFFVLSPKLNKTQVMALLAPRCVPGKGRVRMALPACTLRVTYNEDYVVTAAAITICHNTLVDFHSTKERNNNSDGTFAVIHDSDMSDYRGNVEIPPCK